MAAHDFHKCIVEECLGCGLCVMEQVLICTRCGGIANTDHSLQDDRYISSLTFECPQRRLTSLEKRFIEDALIDYKDNHWIILDR